MRCCCLLLLLTLGCQANNSTRSPRGGVSQSPPPQTGDTQLPKAGDTQLPKTGDTQLPSPDSGATNGNPTAQPPMAGPGITGATPVGGASGECWKTEKWACDAEKLIVDKTNQYRASQGLKPLTFHKNLSYVALQWSQQQASQGAISHSGFPNSREAAYRLEFGNVDVAIEAENVAMTGFGENDPESVAQSFATMWWQSPGHRQNMLGPYSLLGVGVFKNSSGDWYATQIFGE